MFALTLKNLAAHRARLVSTALAVLLGVAFMAGTLVFNDTIDATLDGVVADANAGIDAVVRAPSPVNLSYGEAGPRIDAELATTVREVPGVDDVAIQVFGYAQLVDSDGEPVGDQSQAPAFGLNWVDDGGMNPYDLTDGEPPSKGEIVIDRAMAGSTGYGVGDIATVLSAQEPRSFTISGIATFGGADSFAGATSILFDDATARELFSPDGSVDAITVTAADGVSQEGLVTNLATALPTDGLEVVRGADVVAEDQAAVGDSIEPFKVFMLVFAVVALFVGAFIINNTFSITVAQRTREMAMLRAIGAGRGQILRSVMAEATVIGVVASAAGVGAGVGVAFGLQALMASFGIDLPDGPTVVDTASLVTAFTVGVVITVLSAVLPAQRAGRVRPIEALREATATRRGGTRRRTGIGVATLATGVGVLLVGLGDTDLAMVGIGALVTLLATAVLAPVLARTITGVVGVLLARTGISGRMAVANAQRDATRTARTASSLMIGVALVGFISIMAASLNSSFASALDHDYLGTHVIDTGAYDGQAGLSHELADALRATPGVDTVMASRVTSARIDGDEIPNFDAFDATTMTDTFDLGDVEGELSSLGVDGLAVSADQADEHGWELGSTAQLGLPSGEFPVEVRAIYEDAAWVGDRFVSNELLDLHLPGQLDYRIYVDGDDAAIRATAAPYAADVLDRAEFLDAAGDDIGQILGVVYALLALAVLISLFGITNTLALSVFERTRELGLLRAVGMSRRQVRRTIRAEAVVIAVFGTTLGLAVGSFFGWAVVGALADQGIDTLTFPVVPLAVIAVTAAAAAAAAAAMPARRASRLDVLDALRAQ